MIVRVAFASALVLVAAACGRSGSGEGGGGAPAPSSASTASPRVLSCDRITAASVCSEYTGSTLAQNEAVLTATCGKLKGTFAYAECPNTSILGTCTLATGERRKFFGSGGSPFDAPGAKKECESAYRGKWAPFE